MLSRTAAAAVNISLPALEANSELDLNNSWPVDQARFHEKFSSFDFGGGRLMQELAIDNEFDRMMGLPSVVRSSLSRSANMHGYVATPLVRIIRALNESPLSPDDTFCDIGAGLCRVPMFVRCWSGCSSYGIDLDPALLQIAQNAIKLCNLDRVTVVSSDARTIDYDFANVFFMYQPFDGPVLDSVLARLEQVAQRKPIKLWWLGNHHGWPTRVGWLKWEVDNLRHPWDAVSVARSF